MILSIRTKLFIAMFLACLLAIGGMTALVQFKFKSSLLDYVNEQENRSLVQLESELVEYYKNTGSWQRLIEDGKYWQRLLSGALRSTMFPANGENDPPPPPPPQWYADDQAIGGLPVPRSRLMQRIDRYIGRVVLLDAKKQLIRGTNRLPIPTTLRPLTVNNTIVGYLGLHPRSSLTEKVDVDFADRLQRTLWIVGISTLFLAGFLAFMLARHLVKPIQQLRRGTRQLAEGNYATRMSPSGRDELGQLTRDFNQLAERLQQNEVSRKQWIADIAHELRTPIAILRGEIEALQDGINQPNSSTLASLHQEVLHLQRLVNDLYELSMSDNGALNYKLETCDIIALLHETLDSYGTLLQEQQLSLDTLGVSHQPIFLHGDPQRLQQLFKNLLENSLRYTDKPGRLRISTWQNSGHIILCFQDSPPGVPDEALPRLFERLYRVEGSRNRTTGGAGLGLSIGYNIVKAHNGMMKAAHSPLGGLEICLSLPMATA